MEALTSSFVSKPHGDIRLDQINFYRGPKRPQGRGSPPANDDEWPDIDGILAQWERGNGMEWSSHSSVNAADQGEAVSV